MRSMNRRIETMNKLLIVLAIVIAVSFKASAQTTAPSPASSNTPTVSQNATPQSTDLAEAERLSALVVRLYGEEKYDEALPHARRALEIRERALGRDHQLVGAALNNLAAVQVGRRNIREAENLYERALSIYERNFGAEHMSVAGLLDVLASIRLGNRDYNRAESLYRRALAIRERALGAEHLEIVSSLNNLIRMYEMKNERDPISPLIARAVTILENRFGSQHARLGEALGRYACQLRRGNQIAEADSLELRANAILAANSRAADGSVQVPMSAFACRAIDNPRPNFPRWSVRSNTNYTVRVRVTVDETGRVTSAHAISDQAALIRPTEQAARRARFRPMIVAGRPVPMTGEIMHMFMTTTSIIALPSLVR